VPKSTTQGRLNPIENCYLIIPSLGTWTLNNLPDISDGKDVVFNEDNIMGRSSPIVMYHYSGARNISIQFHMFHYDDQEGRDNLLFLRSIQSLAYPRAASSSAPYAPPEICKFRCGNLLSVNSELCLILLSYRTTFPTDVIWDFRNYMPYKFDIDTSWRVVYTSQDLPINTRIIQSGR